MKFVVQLNKTGKAPAKRIEKDLELQDTYAVLANLWNAGLTHISAENLIKSEQMEAIIQDLIERNVGEEIINFKGKIKNAPFHLRLEGTWDEDGSYELTKIIFYENHYTSKFDLNSVKQKKKAGTAQEVLNTFESTLENDHVLNQEPAPINNASNANEERRFVLNNENQDKAVNKDSQANEEKGFVLVNKQKKRVTWADQERAVVPYDYKNKQLVMVDKTKPAIDQTQQDTKQSTGNEWAHYAKDKLLQVLPHTLVAASAYVFRNPIMAGFTAVASRIGLVAVNAFITPITIVATAVGLSAAFAAARNGFKHAKAESYEAKTDVQLKELSADHVKAFLDGVEAQKSYTAQAKTCFSFNDYRHGNAFFAGMGAAAENKNALIEKIKQIKPQA